MLSQFGHSISLIKIKIAFSRRSVELKTFVFLFIYLFIFFAFFRRTIAEGDTFAPPPAPRLSRVRGDDEVIAYNRYICTA